MLAATSGSQWAARGKAAGLGMIALMTGFTGLLHADFNEDVAQASAALRSINSELEQKVADGNVAESNQALLDFFPEATRTPAQAFVIANMLYGMDARRSYALHKEVAAKFPEEPYVMLEWGMQQHRAGEHAGALAAYDAFSKTVPEFAPVHGLAADCLIRLGKIQEASARWKRSEEAGSGSLEKFESLVCDIYMVPDIYQRRTELRKKTKEGDIDAAVQLVALDAQFERNWWTHSPMLPYLKSDVAQLQTLPDNPRIKAALCAAECRLEEEPKPEAIKELLLKYGFLINDPVNTLPEDGVIISMLLSSAMEQKLMTHEAAKRAFGARLREKSAGSMDVALWNVLANLYMATPTMIEIEEQAWMATGDEKFATGYLTERIRLGTATANDPMVLKALKQFPESANVAALAFAIGVPKEEGSLVQAIKAEYRKFSIFNDPLLRPRARQLRKYFDELAELLEKK